jgi:hypothetical protein
MENYDDWLADQPQSDEKNCDECGEPHQNKGFYCSLQCASESMR